MPCVVFIGFLYTPTLSTTTITSSWYLIWHFKLYPSTSTLIRPSGQSQGIQCLQLAFFSSAANLHFSLMTGDQSSYEGEPPSQRFSSSYDSEDWFNWNSTVYQWGAGRLTLYQHLTASWSNLIRQAFYMSPLPGPPETESRTRVG